MMPGSVASPVFVGRRAELDQISAGLDAAAAGHGRFLLIAGEAGVGKTRLMEEAVRRARESGGLAVVGRCVDLAASGIPFAPIREALRDLAASLGEQRFRALGGARTELAAVLPNLDPTPVSGDRIGVGPDSSQARLFEACLELLRRVGSAQPLLLVVEDIHWADPSTLDLLSYLAKGLAETPLALAATFRSDELHRRHPLQPFLGEIQRARTTERIDVRRFSEGELAEMLGAILGKPAEPDLVSRVHGRSDGNAFYAEELVVVEKSGEPLPPAMRDVLLARVAALSDPAQELLRMISAGGTRVATSILTSVGRSEPGALESSLREAVDRHLLVPGDADGEEYFAFRHALVQEAVYAELLPGERSRLHARFGEALDSGHRVDEASSAELAYHWYAAHDLPRALSASIQAAGWADSIHAYADAQRHYERAIELWDRVVDASERTGLERIDVLERAASAAAETNPPRAAALMLDAVRSAEGSVDGTRAALLKERYGRYAWMAGDGFAALDACREAVGLIPELPPTTARARVLASLGQILMITLRVDEARSTCQEAVEAARAVGAADIECHALNSLGGTNVYLGNLEVGLGLLRESLDISLRIGSVDDAARAQANLVDALSHSGHLEEAGEEAIGAYAFAKEHGLARGMGVLELAEGALAFYRLGRWDQAGELLQRAWRHGVSGVPQIMVEERLAMLDVGQGRLEAASARLAIARPLIGRAVEGQLIGPLAEAAAELALWQARPLEARTEIAAACERLPAEPGYISRLGPLLALGVRAEADVAEIARARRDEHGLSASRVVARGHLETMQRLRDTAVARLPNFVSQADAWLAACQAEATRLEQRSDPVAWDRCADAFGTIPMAYPRAYARWRQAGAMLAVSRSRTSAARPLREAHAIAVELGARPLLEEIDALALRAGMDLKAGASAKRTESAAGAAGDSLGLTRREREILTLIASGRTNRQISEELFITEGTAGTHVSNILGKLGVRARTEAAAVAYKMGLVE